MNRIYLLTLCAFIFLSACSSTNNSSKYKSQTPEKSNLNLSDSSPSAVDDNLFFTKIESGSKALKNAVSEASTKSILSDAVLMSETEKFVDETVDLMRFTFGTNNSIYVANFKNSLLFEHDKSTVKAKDKKLIDQFTQLYGNGTFGKYLYVIGHTDADGTAAYNYALSARRARAVASILLSNNFPESKLNIVPAGEYIPKSTNKSQVGKQLNRRVEIISADSRALIQAYLRQLKCPKSETCGRKLLNVFEVRKEGRSIELSLSNKQSFATYSPELNNLVKLDSALRSGSSSAEMQLLNNDDKRSLLNIVETRGTFTIPLDIRPVFRVSMDLRNFKIPKKYIIQ